MTDVNLMALFSFVLVTTFTPGPNNISSASMGLLYGYRTTLRYLGGIVTGFFLVMLLCGWISSTLLSIFPSVEVALRLVGAGYILWLAFETLRASYTFTERDQTVLGFLSGFLLQVLNAKAIVYGLTLYSTFLASITNSLPYLLLSAFLLATLSFASVTVWTLSGSAISRYLGRASIRRFVNVVLALLLVYTAIELSGLLDVVR